MTHILRLDSDFYRSTKESKESGYHKKFLVSKKNPKIKSSGSISSLLLEGSSTEISSINEMMIRKKLLELTLSFLEPIRVYFGSQINVF